MVELKRAVAAGKRAPAATVRRLHDDNETLVGTVYQLQRYVGNAQVAHAIAQIRRTPATDPSSSAEPGLAPAAFNKMAFISLVYNSVDSATPTSLPQGTKFADTSARQQVNEQGVAVATQQAQIALQDVTKVTDATPDPKKVVPRPTPRLSEPPKPKLKGLDPSKAMAPAKPAAQVPLAEGPPRSTRSW